MKKFLALESADTQDSEETKLDELQGEYDPAQEAADKVELANEILTFSDTVDTVGTLDTIATKLESVEGGVETEVGTALTTAIEHMLARHPDASPKIAFEEYSTRRAKLNQTTLAIEGIRDTLKRLWQRLIEMIRSIVNWFKRVFNMQALRWKAIQAQNERLGEKIKEAKASGVVNKIDAVKPGFIRFANAARTLCVGTAVPTGISFAQHVHDHNAVMTDLHKLFGDNNAAALKYTETAIEKIYSKQAAFETALTSGFSEVVYCPAVMKHSSDQKRFGPLSDGVIVFELPLIFGNKSLFRTAIEHTASLNPGDLHTKVLSSTHAPSPTSISDEVEKMDPDVRETVYTLYKDYGNKVLRFEKERHDQINSLYRSLQAKLEGILKRPGNEPFVSGRGKSVGQLLAMCHHLIDSDLVGLVSYDQTVQSAIQRYAIASY